MTDTVQAIKDKFLLIVCKTIDPFVDRQLLQVASGHVMPVNGAADINVADSFKKIHEDDKKNGTHNVDYIVTNILSGVRDLGYSTSLSAGALITGGLPTLGDIVDELASGAAPI
jgi:hypothetical protein